VGAASAEFAPGQNLTVKWRVTIPHPADNILTGVRIAIHYSNTDSYKDNILAGMAVGDPDKTKVDASLEEYTVTLPPTKTCSPCTLQWMWAAQNDGGFYLECADINIKSSGSSITTTSSSGSSSSTTTSGKSSNSTTAAPGAGVIGSAQWAHIAALPLVFALSFRW
jgi:hypothetical protein